MSIKLECEYPDIKAACNHLRVALPRNKKERATVILEINIKPEEITLSIIGASYKIKTETGIYTKILFPFVYLDTIVNDWEKMIFVLKIDDGFIQHGGSVLESTAIRVIHPENQKKMDLPMNYSNLDILRLEFRYSLDEIRRMNLLEKLDKAKEELYKSVKSATAELSAYNVKYDDIEKIVREKIRNGL
jgi:hypothetical protein